MIEHYIGIAIAVAAVGFIVWKKFKKKKCNCCCPEECNCK